MKIALYLADCRANIIDYSQDIEEAIEHASYNLYGRNKIKVKGVKVGPFYIIIELISPEDIISPTYHLKGIAKYLLANKPETYKPLRIGTRLFSYSVIRKEWEEKV